MRLLFETIKVQNKRLLNIQYHNDRVNRSRFDLYKINKPVYLEQIVKIPEELDNRIYKCRVIYNRNIKNIKFEKYTPRTISSLKLVESNNLEYSYKFSDRTKINQLFELREDCDDILIVENGFITDISFANIIFWDGSKWFTPSTPLLNGTTRIRLLNEGRIFEREIKPEDLTGFEKARIINAMIDLKDSNDILIDKISHS